MVSQFPLKPAYLEPSPLGTKEYWDKLYESEISNHEADPSDVGTIWFDDSAAEDKLLAFLHSPSLALDLEHTSFLDIGTGNGHFLFRLRDSFPPDEDDEDSIDEDERTIGEGEGEGNAKVNVKHRGFQGRIVGTDYSHQGIEFARRIASTRVPPIAPAIEFLQHDIMAPPPPPPSLLDPPNEMGYDVVLDKGTFDAVSLSAEPLPAADNDSDRKVRGRGGSGNGNGNAAGSGGGRRLCEGYRDRIMPLVRDGGLFLVTSCNWTEEELRGWFEGGDEGGWQFVFETGLKYRSFKFGGREGQSISSVCFRKKGRGA